MKIHPLDVFWTTHHPSIIHIIEPPTHLPHRRFLSIFREVWNKTIQKIKFLVVLLTKILEIVVWPIKCAHFKYYVNTMSTSREILFFTPLAYKPNLENLTFIFKTSVFPRRMFWIYISHTFDTIQKKYFGKTFQIKRPPNPSPFKKEIPSCLAEMYRKNDNFQKVLDPIFWAAW